MSIDFGFVVPPCLIITLTDSGSDGWNGNVLGIKQNNMIIATFKMNSYNSSSEGPYKISVQGDSEIRIITVNLGLKTQEVGFAIKVPNGTLIL